MHTPCVVFLYVMDDADFMQRALRLARRARGRTNPNPMVGAVIAKQKKIIGEGYHKRPGTGHAEVIAIDAASSGVKGSILYVTLEPCCHRDKRTPPCTDKIISSGVSRVVIAMQDPNPKVSGRGIAELRNAGITVDVGVLEKSARQLNEAYAKHVATGMPLVILKTAMTLDGKIATPGGESKWITGEPARRMVHRLRGSVDAIITAIGTVRADNPQMTCRSGGRSPLRVVVDPELRIDPKARILQTPPCTIIVTQKNSPSTAKESALIGSGAEILYYESKRTDLTWLLRELGKRNVMSVLVEGGASLNASFLDAGIVDKVMFFIAPKIMGGRESVPVVGGRNARKLSDALKLERTKFRRIGDDFLIEGYIAR